MAAPIRVLELRSVRGTGGGPEKTILFGAAKAHPDRVATTVCYLRDARDPLFNVDARAGRLGVDYVEVREQHSFDPSIWPTLRRLVRDRQVDIVHAHDYKTDLLALALARAERVVPLATVHGWTGNSWREQAYYAADKRLLARFPRLIAVSNEIRAELLRTGARSEHITVIPNAIDHGLFRRDRRLETGARATLGMEPGDVAIGAIGRLERQKRFDVLLRAFDRVRRVRPEVRLFIAGEGALRRDLESAARDLGLARACRFLGYRADVPALHHGLDLFVQSSEYEGTPNVVLEAMALGTPIVATEVGGTSDLIDHDVHGLLVPPRDPEALAWAIEQTLADPQATARWAAAARARVEREFSFDARTLAVEAMYEELVVRREQSQHRGALQSDLATVRSVRL